MSKNLYCGLQDLMVSLEKDDGTLSVIIPFGQWDFADDCIHTLFDFSERIGADGNNELPDDSPSYWRINDHAFLEYDSFTAKYIIKRQVAPGDGETVYLCPVCASKGPHVLLPEVRVELMSSGKMVFPTDMESAALHNCDTECICSACDFRGHIAAFDVTGWDAVEPTIDLA